MKRLLSAMLAVVIGLSFIAATPPAFINYQGVVRDSSGAPLNGLVTMTFRFYDDPTAGTLLWEEVYDPTLYPPQLTVANGLFTVALGDPAHRFAGSETTFSNVFANHTDVFLAVRVAADAEMTPRVKVISSAFALNAQTLAGKSVLTAAQGGTGISSSGPAGNVLVSDGSSWTSSSSAASCANADTLDSYHAGYFLDTSSTTQTKTGKLTLNSAADYGIQATGPTAGGYLANSDGTSHISAGLPNKGMEAFGAISGGSFSNSYGDQVLLASYDGLGFTGVWAQGTERGGYFQDGGISNWASVAGGGYGIYAKGVTAGGYFEDPDTGSWAYCGYGDNGISARGPGVGGYFDNSSYSGYAYAAIGDYGIQSFGNTAGGYFKDSNSSGEAIVGYSTYKISGTGTVSFVQNHPTEKDKVIVYACPEGDEVATYTRGTAKLVNGEARVKLGETFQWVTNPDLGLTAHVTPREKWTDLFVESVSTTELIVKSKDGSSDNAFDFIVYGLRIGFEESGIVQEKQRESYIPSFNDHRERYVKYPQLRSFNALERFKKMESSTRGIDEASIDLSSAIALKDAIHEYDPATDPPVEKLSGMTPPSPAKEPDRSSHPVVFPVPTPPAMTTQTVSTTEPFAINRANDTVVEKRTELPCFQVSEAVEAGEIVVMDPSSEGFVFPCRSGSDPMVVGIAADSTGDCRSGVSVATSGVVPCKVDAGYGPIRRGDLLVASPTPGHAMKAIKPIGPGTVVGKALEPLESGTGLIKIVVMLR